jgi:AraC-like DNA-binding protein
MIESHTIYSFFNFAAFILSIIVFIDVLLQVKRPFILKAYFLVLVFSVGAYSFLLWLSFVNLYILLCFPVFKFSIWASMTLILSHFYISDNKSWVKWILGFACIILLYSNTRMFFYLKDFNYSETNFGSSVIDVFTQKVSFKVNLLPRLLLLLTFTGINLRIAYLIFKKSEDTNHYYERIRNWTKTFVFLELMSVVLFSIMNSFLISYDGGNIMLIIIAFMVLLNVLYRPRFINTQSIKLSLSSKFRRDESINLSDANFYTPFFTNHYYLQEDATLEQFCIQNGISSNEELQDQILKKYNMSFSNLVNKNRVDYFVELVRSPNYTNYSIDALAKEAGFNSRHHLYKPFRKFHGGTPSDFISSINN